MPDGWVRSTTLARMSALSLTWVVRERIRCWAVSGS